MARHTLSRTSKGHMGTLTTPNGTVEVYQRGDDVYTAPLSNVIDVTTGARHGRYVCSARQLRHYGSDIALGPGFEPA